VSTVPESASVSLRLVEVGICPRLAGDSPASTRKWKSSHSLSLLRVTASHATGIANSSRPGACTSLPSNRAASAQRETFPRDAALSPGTAPRWLPATTNRAVRSGVASAISTVGWALQAVSAANPSAAMPLMPMARASAAGLRNPPVGCSNTLGPCATIRPRCKMLGDVPDHHAKQGGSSDPDRSPTRIQPERGHDDRTGDSQTDCRHAIGGRSASRPATMEQPGKCVPEHDCAKRERADEEDPEYRHHFFGKHKVTELGPDAWRRPSLPSCRPVWITGLLDVSNMGDGQTIAVGISQPESSSWTFRWKGQIADADSSSS
jgi:hypothetical protein